MNVAYRRDLIQHLSAWRPSSRTCGWHVRAAARTATLDESEQTAGSALSNGTSARSLTDILRAVARPLGAATPQTASRRLPVIVGWVLVVLGLSVVVLAVVTTWTYQTAHAGDLDGLETLYVQVLGLPWIWLPLGWHTDTSHGFTAVAAIFDLLNWVIASALILFVAYKLAATGRRQDQV